jgi:hypothetical protein
MYTGQKCKEIISLSLEANTHKGEVSLQCSTQLSPWQHLILKLSCIYSCMETASHSETGVYLHVAWSVCISFWNCRVFSRCMEIAKTCTPCGKPLTVLILIECTFCNEERCMFHLHCTQHNLHEVYCCDVEFLNRLVLWVNSFRKSCYRPDLLWGPTTFHPVGTGGSFPRGWSGRGVKLTTHIQLVPRPRQRGSIHPLPPYVFMAQYLIS